MMIYEKDYFGTNSCRYIIILFLETLIYFKFTYLYFQYNNLNQCNSNDL